MRVAAIVLLAALWGAVLPPAGAEEGPLPAAAGVPADADAHATATLSEGRFRVRYAPGEVTPEGARRAAAEAERSLRRVEGTTGAAVEGPVTLVLHGSVDLLRRRTASPEGVEALTAGRATVHQGADFEGDHEMAHVLARTRPRRAGAPPTEPLWEEGFATALAPPGDDVPLAPRAAVEARLGILPPLARWRRGWPAGGAAARRAYLLCGAFVAHVAETRGWPAVLRRLSGEGDGEAFGADGDTLEREWHDALLALEVPEAEEIAVRRSLGLPAERLAEPPGERVPLPSFDDEERWARRGGGTWGAAEASTVGGPEDRWAVVLTRRSFDADVALSLRLRRSAGATVALRLHAGPERSDDVLFGPSDTAATVDGGAGGFVRTPLRVRADRWTRVDIRCRGAGVRVYLDGWLALEAEGGFRAEAGSLGVAVLGGRFEIGEPFVQR